MLISDRILGFTYAIHMDLILIMLKKREYIHSVYSVYLNNRHILNKMLSLNLVQLSKLTYEIWNLHERITWLIKHMYVSNSTLVKIL